MLSTKRCNISLLFFTWGETEEGNSCEGISASLEIGLKGTNKGPAKGEQQKGATTLKASPFGLGGK